MSDANDKDFVFGSNWAQNLDDRASAPAAGTKGAARGKPDVGDFALLGDEGEENTDSPLLDQGEVDSLWGKSSVDEEKKQGLGQLINSQSLTVERLPALDGIYERFARIAAGSMRYFTSENVDVSFGKIVPVRFGDFLNSVELPSLIVIFKAAQWESRGLIVLDNQLIYSIVDILHGGRRTRQLPSNEGKPYTVIETRMIERMINIILNDLESAFDPVSVVNFHFERMENDQRFATIALPTNTAVVADFTMGIERRSGTMRVVMPYRTLEPVKAELSQQLLGENFGEYGTWARHFSDSVRVSNIDLEAVLSEFQTTLGEAFSWKRGSMLNIDLPLDPQVNIRSGGASLFVANMGRKEGHLALRLIRRAETEGSAHDRAPKKRAEQKSDQRDNQRSDDAPMSPNTPEDATTEVRAEKNGSEENARTRKHRSQDEETSLL